MALGALDQKPVRSRAGCESCISPSELYCLRVPGLPARPTPLGWKSSEKGVPSETTIQFISGKEIGVLSEIELLSEVFKFWGILFKAPSHGCERKSTVKNSALI